MLISLFVVIVFYLVGVIVSLTYRSAFGASPRQVLSSKKHYLGFGLIGFCILSVLVVITSVQNRGVSLLDSFLMQLPNVVVVAVFLIIAYIIGFVITLFMKKIFPQKESGIYYLIVAFIATAPILLFTKAIGSTLLQ